MNRKERYKKIKSAIKKLFEPTETKKPAEISDPAVLGIIKSNWTRTT